MFETVNLVVSSLIMPLVIAWLIVSILFDRAVGNTETRYVLATWGIIITVTIATLDLIASFAYLMREEYFNAGWSSALGALTILISLRFFKDDNWFRRKFRKLKDGAKRLAKDLQERLSTIGSAVPSPA